MKRLPGRQLTAYGLGVVTAVAGFAVGTAWAGHSADSGTISACVQHGNGSLYLKDAGGCKKNDTPISWSITGPQGPKGDKGAQGDTGATGPQGPAGAAGTFSNAKSPNGIFSVTLGNSGIVLRGPNGKVVVDFGGAHVVTIAGASTP